MATETDITVEDLTCCDDEARADLEQWNRLGRQLKKLDPERYRRACELARTYISIYENPDESDEAFDARLDQIMTRRGAN